MGLTNYAISTRTSHMTAFLGGVVACATTENSSTTKLRSETSIHLLLKGIVRLTVILGVHGLTVFVISRAYK